MASEKFYIVAGAKIQCNKGVNIIPLNLPKDHGVYVKNKPVLNCMDNMVGLNISTFGVCSVTQKPCMPAILGPWQKPNNKNLIGGCPAITKDSYLICGLGGKISFMLTGQEG